MPNTFLLQIGACDGFINDPCYKYIKRYNLSALLLEPQKEVFEKELKALHKDSSNVTLLNMAVSSYTGKRTLYKIAFSKKRWATGLAKFSKENMHKTVESNYIKKRAREAGVTIPQKVSDRFYEEVVSCITFEDLCNKYKITTIDILQTDTEGHDFEIVMSINFDSIKPQIINFEHHHMSNEEKILCYKHLKQNDYILLRHGVDMCAFLKPPIFTRNSSLYSKVKSLTKLSLIGIYLLILLHNYFVGYKRL